MTTITRNVYVDGQKVAVNAPNPATAVSPRTIHTGGMPARVSTDGTDATPVVTETYLAEIHVPTTVTTTGVAVMNGTVASGNITVGIYTPGGACLGQSASTAQAGTDVYQLVPLALTLLSGTYYVALQVDNVTGRFNTHVFGSFGAGKLTSQTYGVMANATMPTTFTTALGPIASLY